MRDATCTFSADGSASRAVRASRPCASFSRLDAWYATGRRRRLQNALEQMMPGFTRFVVFVLASLQVLASGQTGDEAAIRRIVADQVVAWNAGDGRKYAERLAPDAAFTNLFGMVMYGAPAFEKRH